tara:strand:+ start:1657 stop:2736 length:1080 start_codon:yes stop_codon:yes gene_type:complete
MATIKNATLYLWIYTGEFGVKPTDPNYVLYKEVKTGSDLITFEVSELIRDYIDVVFTGDYFNVIESVWAEWTMVQVYDDNTTVDVVGEVIAFNSYGYFKDGVNPALTVGALYTNDNIYNYAGQPIYFPVMTGGDAAFQASYYDGNTLIRTDTFGTSIQSITADSNIYTVDSTTITADAGFITGSSSQLVQRVQLPSNTTKVEVVLNNNTTETKYIKTIEECKYAPNKISFLNRYGIVQDLWFFKRKDESVNIQKNNYLENTLTETNNIVSYSLNDASNIPSNFKVTKGLKLNTGFVTEDHNQVIQELLLTERAWIHENSNVFPIIPKTTSLQYKTSLNDNLINFTVDFDYAYNEINLIK